MLGFSPLDEAAVVRRPELRLMTGARRRRQASALRLAAPRLRSLGFWPGRGNRIAG
ncbi:hypothetical protein SAMN05216551_101285 [Chitinasiproducens palmae]|uniref:Uncharacterized protein n=1 Tax=Chitinasiproducens palmae TaxID=1770053 RepID=A0A1H2PJ63_9BURK|nr:hypothetical protein SAMN05216551_101285 [Chitinasiproducens palmae]